jgi:hypothetical protein
MLQESANEPPPRRSEAVIPAPGDVGGFPSTLHPKRQGELFARGPVQR